MKLIKLYNNFKIDFICKRYGIENYTINSDGSVDVDSDVNLNDNRLTKLPLNFGKVSGYFNCGYNKLITLEGCPQSVGGNFYCYDNQLTSLEFCPQSVRGDFHFYNNRLKDLYNFPEFFDGTVYYHGNPVTEILDLFIKESYYRLGKVIDLLNEYDVIQQDGKLVILDRLEEVFHTLNIKLPEINLKKGYSNYEVY